MQKTPNLWQVTGLVILSMFLIVGGDAAGKILGQNGFSSIFVAWARFALAAIVLLPLAGLQWDEMRHFKDWRLYLRTALIVGGISCILTALNTEPMANVFGAFFVGPIVAYALSAIVLGDKATWARSVLLLISFAGVLVVIRPGFDMSFGMALAFLAGCFHGSYLVATRWLAGSFRPRFLLISQLLIGAVMLAPVAIGPVPTITPGFGILLALSALGSAMGNLILVIVNKSTPTTTIAPLIYSQIIAATILGFAIFGDVPDAQTMIGLVVIIAAGASSVWFAGRGR